MKQEEQRYREIKIIWDIIHDIWLPSGVEKMKLDTADFVESVLGMLSSFALRIDELDPRYSQAGQLIIDFDRIFLEEQRTLLRNRKLMKEGQLFRGYVEDHITMMKSVIDHYESEFNLIRESLDCVTMTFADQEDQYEFEYKTDTFNTLYTEIYIDIAEILYSYENLLKNTA